MEVRRLPGVPRDVAAVSRCPLLVGTMVAASAASWSTRWLRPEVCCTSWAAHTCTLPLCACRLASRSVTEPLHNGQVYPIIVAISGACSVCVFQCLRHLTQSPDVSLTKSDRMMGVKEDKRFVKDGERFREHGVRRCGPTLRGFGRGHGPSP